MIKCFGFIVIVIIAFCTGTTKADGAAYVGAKGCRLCHAKKYTSWKQTGLADSFENLRQGVKVELKLALGVEDKDYTADPACLPCHTTGFGKGGFTSIEDTPHLAGITCEACHGPGGSYRKLMRRGRDALIAAGMVVPEEQICLSCHAGDSPFVKDRSFNYQKRKAKTHDHSTRK